MMQASNMFNGLVRGVRHSIASMQQTISIRRSSFIGKDLTKFYKKAHITQVPGRAGYFEINLDTKKLKTPIGNIFQVPGESLALAVAAEWNSQNEKIKRHAMHITSLCNTAIDNPTHRTRSQVIRAICHFLGSDTLCYRMNEPEKLLQFQQANWDPVLKWFRKRYGIELEPTVGILSPEISDNTHVVLEKQLMSYSDWTLVGLQQLVDCLKSLSLALALCESEIDVQRAVYLSRLEQAFQVEQWGSVEWYHDIDLQETQARVAAATLFIHFCHDFSSTQRKQKTSAYKMAHLNAPQRLVIDICLPNQKGFAGSESANILDGVLNGTIIPKCVTTHLVQQLLYQKLRNHLVKDVIGINVTEGQERGRLESILLDMDAPEVHFKQVANKLLYDEAYKFTSISLKRNTIQALLNQKIANDLSFDLQHKSQLGEGVVKRAYDSNGKCRDIYIDLSALQKLKEEKLKMASVNSYLDACREKTEKKKIKGYRGKMKYLQQMFKRKKTSKNQPIHKSVELEFFV